MTSNPEPIVQQLEHDFQNLLADVTGPDARSQTAYSVELTLFRRLLTLGEALLRLFFITRAAVRPAEPVTAPDGTRLTYHDQRRTTYDPVFGKVRFWRHAFTASGQDCLCPLDAELSLPAHCYSDLLREWAVSGTTDVSYRQSQAVLERILGLPLSFQALETGVAGAGQDVTTFYEQPAMPPTSPPVGTTLVVQADGKGAPMVQPPTQTPPVRLGKGQKRGTKKEAIVTSLYTIAPYPRTPQEVVAALLQDRGCPEVAARSRPVGKELRATLEGKAAAMSCLAPRVAQREGLHIQQRVALTDGAEALLEETHPQRLAWVRAYLEPLLAGQTDAVITALEAEGQDPTHTAAQRQAVQRTVGYYRRNRPYMRYDEYLARGWPIGTGVVEGACRHLVKDRMEQSGMRWTTGGAQALLDLRAVRINGHWEAYWLFHRQQQHQRLYGRSAPAPTLAEVQTLEWAA